MTRRSAKSPRGYQSGFTLVEVLIAIFIFSLISVGSLSALTSAINGKAQIEQKLAFINDIQLARTLMQSDFDNAVLRQSRDNFGAAEPYSFQGGVDTLVSFTRVGRANPGGLERRGDLQRVSYVFDNGRLIRRALAHENPAQNTDVLDRVLLSRLTDVEIRFYMRGQDLPVPFAEIPAGSDAVPNGLSLLMTFDDGRSLSQSFELDL